MFRNSLTKHWPLGCKARPMKVFNRTPITQLTENDRRLVMEIMNANQLAVTKLRNTDLNIDIFEHEVRDRQTQLSFLADSKKPAIFRKERLNGLLKANIFHEIFIDTSLSVSGGYEHGYFRLLLKQHRTLSQETRNAICGDWGRYITPLQEGGCFLTLFVGQLPTTTLYKADPYSVPLLLISEKHNHIMPTEEAIKKTLPGVLICEDFTQLADTYVKAYKMAHLKIMDSQTLRSSYSQFKPR